MDLELCRYRRAGLVPLATVGLPVYAFASVGSGLVTGVVFTTAPDAWLPPFVMHRVVAASDKLHYCKL